MRRRTAWTAAVAACALLAAACGGGGAGGEGGADPVPTTQGVVVPLVATVESFDLAVGPADRLMVRLATRDLRPVAYGAVRLELRFLDETNPVPVESAGPPTIFADGRYLPTPGNPGDGPGERPTIVPAAEGRGVYAAPVAFDRAGWWQVAAVVDLKDSGVTKATAEFEVLADHRLPAVGEKVPGTRNLTMSSTGVPPAAIDSRAATTGRVPDPELHRTTVAEAVAAGRPAVVVFSSPAFRQNRFSGDLTQLVADLAGEHGGRAAFIHVELWRDFPERELNDAATDWLQPSGGAAVTSPWVFVVDRDGRVAARFDNVVSRADLEAALDRVAPA
jgi:hypothetical protein